MPAFCTYSTKKEGWDVADQDECKGCRGTVRMSKEEINRIFDDAYKVKEVKLASSDVYLMRMKLCNDCNALQYGTTCKFCGCLVAIKAKLAHTKCPYPFAERW